MTDPGHEPGEESIRFSLLLKPHARVGDGPAAVAQMCAELGLRETGRGRTTLSLRTTRERFAALFGAEPRSVDAGEDELGATSRPGSVLDIEPTPPDVLADYVELVTVEPPASLFEGTMLETGENPIRGGDDVDLAERSTDTGERDRGGAD